MTSFKLPTISQGEAGNFSSNLGAASLQYSVNEMIAWRKLMKSGPLMVPNFVVILAISDCQNHNVCPPPGLDSISPNNGSQGDVVPITITGPNYSLPEQCSPGTFVVQVDGVAGAGVYADPPLAAGNGTLTTNLHIAPNAYKGAHYISVRNDEGTSEWLPFFVTCPGCAPPPELVDVVNKTGSPLTPNGSPVTVQLTGTHFSNNNALVQIDGPGISYPSGPYTVQNNGSFDYIVLPITADASATTGFHNVRIKTDSGTSNGETLTVNASQPPPAATPGGPPFLNKITPEHISKNSQALVFIKCEGSGFSGFGIYRDVVFDFITVEALRPHQASYDQVAVVAIATFGLPYTVSTARVHNVADDTLSNSSVLFLDEPRLGQPWVTAVVGGVTRGGDADVVIFGQNLDGVTDQSFSGVAGLTFSNTQTCGPNNPACPGFAPGEGCSVHVHADLNAPVSGDEATNLIITTAHGPSNPFAFFVSPPGP